MRLSPRIMVLVLMIALPVVAEPTITFDASAVVASGITPNGQVAWFSIAWDRWQGMNRVTRRDRIDTDAGTGEVTFDLDGPVPVNSIWVAVDLSTGTYSAARPGDPQLKIDALPGAWLEKGAGGAVDALQADRDFLEILVARPGVGAWGESVGHGGASDLGGGADGVTRAGLGAMRPIGRTASAPSKATPGDVVVLIDPNAMQCFAATLGSVR